MSLAASVLRLVALVLLAALAGFFYAYWASVMPGLVEVGPQAGVGAMQAINRVVRNAAFAPAFFGPLLVVPLAALAQARLGADRAAAWLAAAFAAHALAVAITFFVNVPLNQALAPLAADAAQTHAFWRGYLAEWGTANFARMMASFASVVFCGLSLSAKESART